MFEITNGLISDPSASFSKLVSCEEGLSCLFMQNTQILKSPLLKCEETSLIFSLPIRDSPFIRRLSFSACMIGFPID